MSYRIRRSGFEEDVEDWLRRQEVEYEYEAETFQLWLPVLRGHKCVDCGGKSVVKSARYTPDFFLSNGLVIETKGKFGPLDRKKALAMRDQHPDVDYRLVFQRDNKLSKNSTTRYTEWSEKHGIPCSVGRRIPLKWLT